MINLFVRNLRLLFVLVALSLVAWGLNSYVNSALFQGKIVTLLSRVLPVDLSLSRLRVGLWRGTFSLEDLVVSTDAGLRVQARTLAFRISPLSLLRGQLVLASLEADHVKAVLPELEQEEPVTLNQIRSTLERLSQRRSLSIHSSQIQDLTVELKDKTFHAARLELGLSSRSLTEYAWKIHLDIHQGGMLGGSETLNLRLVLEASPTAVQVKSLKVSRDGFEATTEGRVWFQDASQMQGQCSGSMTISKLLTKPLDLKAAFVLQEKKAGELSLELQELQGHLGEAVATVTGQLNFKTKQVHLDFQGKQVALAELFGNANSVVLKYAEGQGTVTGQGNGVLPEIKLEANAVIDDFRYKDLAAKKASGTLTFQWPRLQYAADIYFPKVGEARAPCRSTGDLDFSEREVGTHKILTTIRKIDVICSQAPLDEALPTLDLSGEVTGGLVVSGKEDAVSGHGVMDVKRGSVIQIPFDRIRSKISFNEKTWLFEDAEVIYSDEDQVHFSSPVRLDIAEDQVFFSGHPIPELQFKGDYHLRERQLRLNTFIYDSPYGRFEVAGTTQWHEGSAPQINYTCQGPLPAEKLSLIWVIQEASGLLKTKLHLTGAYPQDLSGQGQLELEGVNLDFRSFRGNFTAIHGRIDLDGKNLTFRNLEGGLDDGAFSIKGRLGFSGLETHDFDLKLKASDFPFFKAGYAKGELMLDLVLQGSVPDPLVRGTIDITNGKYFRNYAIRDLVLKPVLESEEDETQPRLKFLDQTRLDLSLKNSGDFWIDNNLISKLYLKGDLKIKGRFERPVMTGEVQVLPSVGRDEGVISLLGARFQVVEGNINFDSPTRNNPLFDVLAKQYYEDIAFTQRPEISLRIKGRLDNLRIVPETSSVDQRDFSCLLLYGVSCQEARQTNKNTGGTVASALIGEQVSLMLDETSHSQFSPDIFRLETGGGDQSTISKVTVGKTFTDRLSVEFTTDFAPEIAERTVKANYFLTDNVLFSARRTRTAIEESRYRFNIVLRFEMR